jgi:hypothetical protein
MSEEQARENKARDIIEQLTLATSAAWIDTDIFDPKTWKRPESPSFGPGTNADIFLAIGEATNAWEGVEEILAQLLLIFSDPKDLNSFKIIRRIFGSIESSAQRREALTYAAEVHFGDHWKDVKPVFNKFKAGLSEASRRRDEIVHGNVYTFSSNGTGHGVFLFPTSYNSARNNLHPDMDHPLNITGSRYRYSYETIADFAKKFHHMRGEIFRSFPNFRKVNGTPAYILNKMLKG